MQTITLEDILFPDKSMGKAKASDIAGKRLGEVTISELVGIVRRTEARASTDAVEVAAPRILELPMTDDEEE